MGWVRIALSTGLLLGAAAGAPAADDVPCGPETPELRLDRGGGSMSRVPVMDQDGLGICYSYAGTQLVDAYRFSHDNPPGDANYHHSTSPIASAVGSALDEGILFTRSDMTGGQACTVAGHVRSGGSCDHQSLRETFGGLTIDQLMARLRVPFDQYRAAQAQYASDLQSAGMTVGYDRISADRFTSRVAALQAELARSRRQRGQEAMCLLRAMGYPGEFTPPLDVIEKLLEQYNPLVYFEGMLTQGCGGNHTLALPSSFPSCTTSGTNLTDGAEYVRRIHERLGMPNPQPVEINYCANVLSDPAYRGRTWRKIVYWPASDCRHHSSLVIGRRWKATSATTGRCQLLVRNSWGTSCNFYPAPVECDSGNIWVDADALAGNISRISYLE